MENMSDRIRQRRKELKLTQQALAELAGVNRVTVTGWESNEYQPNGINIIALCEALGCSPAWLVSGVDTPEVTLPPQTRTPLNAKKIPLISWVQAGTWTTTDSGVNREDVEKWIYTTATVSDKAFALKVRGDSMTNPNGFPSIPEGSIIVVEPVINGLDSINGKVVVAYLDGGTEATLKKFIDDWPNKYLVPLNPNYKVIECNEGCSIVGQVKQVIMDLN
ncbi:helix-turn-helix domain-containing protein [Salmonella enterica]|uniref:LexA family protein n=1 Tax=Salmonella enterica TaxID=28901 RepID=UPI000FB4A857|nr:helix-turn-helix domain-containing protein [Salmonella enterica]EHK3918189.1 helix-turn-helix domain-containing protein [Salmonella enterica subsp. enterica serovar Poona]EHN6577553.1 helix-turn-helix domain-containing protein [Salmonella enterica subsp. enterica serovar Anecho]EKO0905036.1 helix-turn-helix domain-containing protein [Salmonella enterica subsp. enterica]EKR1710233.1 helix-turn-helix domain-containing protein [Salmonella enterica subsp. enterica serovar Carrau]MLT78437.1 LexA